MLVDLVILLCGAGLSAYLYITRNFGYWKRRGVTYEKPIPIFGNLWKSTVYLKTSGEISAEAYRKYPQEKVVGMFHYDTPVLLIRDPQLVYKIFVTDFSYFSDNGMTVDEKVDPVFSRHMFFQKGEKWKRTRQVVSPAFTVSRIKPVFGLITDVGKMLREYIGKNPGEHELKYLMSRYSSEIVASCAIGIDGRCFQDESPKIIKMGQLIFQPSYINGIIQNIVFLLPRISKLFRVKMVSPEFPKFFNDILRDVIDYRQENPNSSRQDLMQYWIEMRKKSMDAKQGNVKPDDQIKEAEDHILNGIITFFIDTYETTSMVASFALYYMAMDKDLQDRVRAEIEDTYQKGGNQLTYEAVSDMSLLNNIILEVLRLHPALLHALKTCTRDYHMDIGKSEPLLVEEGTIIVIPNLALSNDPKYWKDPEKFYPDRFDEMEKDQWKKGQFFPFGEGPRMCIGMRIAYIVAKVGLIHALKDFEVTPTERTPRKFVQDARHFMSCSRDGLYARFVKRD